MKHIFYNSILRKRYIFCVICTILLSSYDHVSVGKKISHTDNKKSSLLLSQDPSKENVGSVIIYVVKSLKGDMNYWKEYGEEIYLAIPIVIFSNGKFIKPPYCEAGAKSREAMNDCNAARIRLSPFVQPGSKLFILNNGIKESSIAVYEEINYGLSDWTRPSGLLPYRPAHALLTNNPRIGSNQLLKFKNNDWPVLSRRKKLRGSGYYSDVLLSKVDIDGDRIPELIYKCDDSEGVFYVIYSKKNGRWSLEYKGGYDGV